MCSGDELVIEPAALDHDLEDTGKERRITARLDRKIEVAGSRDWRDPRILHDDAGAQFARLPDVVGGDWRALGDVRPCHPDHFCADHVGPRVGGAIDPEGLLVGRSGADHAQPAVVVDERRLQTDARKLAEEIRLLRRQARAPEHRDGAAAVRLLEAGDLGRHFRDRVPIRHVREAGRRRRVPSQRRQESIGMRTLQVPLDAFRAQHPAIEGKVLPRLEPDDLVVADFELNAALLPAEAAMRFDEPVGFNAR